MKEKVLIVGAGLSGMSCAFQLRKARINPFLIEREMYCGGLASSFNKNGFTFDYSGHLLHLRWPDTTNLVKNLLKDNIVKIKRNSAIYFNGNMVPYPFQANLSFLPEKERNYCVKEFLKAVKKNSVSERNFKEWTISVFGKGISNLFMLPYNEKLWRYPLNKMSLKWMGNFVPVPDSSRIIEGAYSKAKNISGYNGVFFYPLKGAIGALSTALSKKAGLINYGCELVSLKAYKKVAIVKGIGEISYSCLANTSSLKELIERTLDAPDKVKEAAHKLKSNIVYILNIGLRKKVSNHHWLYFPQKEYPFYRIGFYDNFSHFCAPDRKSSLYAEIAVRENESIDLSLSFKEIVNSLKKIGFIKGEEDIEITQWLKASPAYAFYDLERENSLKIINDWLISRDIFSIGRYGAWKYSFMEENIKDGIETGNMIAEKISKI